MRTNLESLPCTSETHMLYVNYAPIKRKEERKEKEEEEKRRAAVNVTSGECCSWKQWPSVDLPSLA